MTSKATVIANLMSENAELRIEVKNMNNLLLYWVNDRIDESLIKETWAAINLIEESGHGQRINTPVAD